ncbi:MAG: type 4a pilus biogenesis protein PilO [Deltaproteobacteria bacterium]|nr:MAG: type 4a pilus biogenesis protein PilO [Deltaproteobacteria bacterium]
MAVDIKKGLGSVKLPNIPWNKLNKLTKLHKILIAVGVVGSLWGGFIWFLFMPQTESIAKLDRDLRTARSELSRLKDVEKNLRQFKKKLRRTEIQFKKALQLLPDKEEIPTLLSSISNLGATSGLEFLLFQPQSEVRRNFYAEIPLKLELSGPYHNVATFFDQVSKLSRIVSIGNVQMSRLGKGKGADRGVILKTGCTATTYKFIEPSTTKKKGQGKKKRKK